MTQWLFEPLERLLFHRSTVDLILPPPPIRSWDWIRENIRTKDGLPFNAIDYPWTEGICDAWDNPRVRTIWLQFAARLGKSLIAQALLIKSVRTQPAPAMISTSTEELLKDTIQDKLYPMFEKSLTTRSLLPPPHLRPKTRINLRTCPIYGAWSGSTTKLADKDPRYKWGFEIDKWVREKSDEADSLALFLERGLEIPDGKTILESTPAKEGTSRVNKGLKKGTNCRFRVPCKWCGHHQQLVRGSGKTNAGGLVWDKDANGHSTPALAYKTARYVCSECHREIHDEDRRPMIRRGVWCAEGCWVDKRGRLHGAAVNEGPDASFQLGRLYAPTFTFADNAKHWVESLGDRDEVRNHVNSWDGEVWALVRHNTDWRALGEKLCRQSVVLERVPAGTAFLTCAVDVQVDHFVFAVVAWGPQSVGRVIHYGVAHSWDQVREIIEKRYEPAFLGAAFPIQFTLIDARDGNRTEEVIAFCRSVNKTDGPWVYPSMGEDAKHMSGKTFKRNEVGIDNKVIDQRSDRKGLTGFYLIMINTNYWETWMHNCLFVRDAGEARSIVLPWEAREDEDFLSQLLNVARDSKETDTDEQSRKWVRINRGIPKDFRDTVRYARVAAEVYTNGNWARVVSRQPGLSTPVHAAAPRKPPPAIAPPPVESKPWVKQHNRDRFVRRKG